MYKFLTIIFVAIFVMIIIYIMVNPGPNMETFEVILGDKKSGTLSRVHLQHFFQFVEYYQTEDMAGEQKRVFPNKSQEEMVEIKNKILDLLKMLHFIINVNDKDNYYSRFLVIKVGSNLEYSKQFPFRRQNYDELVKGHVGKQFTFLPPNEYDNYYPKPSVETSYQNPLPNTINVHNYYTAENTEVNLMALKMLLEKSHGQDPNKFNEIIHPSEYDNFIQEFLVPLTIIRKSIVYIANTNMYKNYLKSQKFSDKYKPILFKIDEMI